MTITTYPISEEFYQGSPAWHAARCGLLTASEMDLCITPAKLQAANNDGVRAHVYELAAQRITQYVEPSYIGDDMLRGKEDEEYALMNYEQHYGPIERVSFITNSKWGFTLGYSPDALVGDRTTIEVKSKKQYKQLRAIIDGVLPTEHLIQVQTGLMIAERDACEFVSYCGGMPMMTLRIEADYKVQEAIIRAATLFEERAQEAMEAYRARLGSGMRLIPTTRVEREEIRV